MAELNGLLEIDCVKARDLNDGFDPFCKVFYQSVTVETEPDIDGEQNPEWNETLQFNVNGGSLEEEVRLEVWDKDDLMDQLMGAADTTLDELLGAKEQEIWLAVFSAEGESGELCVKARFIDGGRADIKRTEADEEAYVEPEQEEEVVEVKKKSDKWEFVSQAEREGLQALVPDDVILDLAFWFDLIDEDENQYLSLDELKSYFGYSRFGESGYYSPQTMFFHAENKKKGLSHDEFFNFVIGLHRRAIHTLDHRAIVRCRKRFEDPFGLRPHYTQPEFGQVKFDSWAQQPDVSEEEEDNPPEIDEEQYYNEEEPAVIQEEKRTSTPGMMMMQAQHMQQYAPPSPEPAAAQEEEEPAAHEEEEKHHKKKKKKKKKKSKHHS